MNQKVYDSYIKILNKELIPALGCTEPIAIAYAAAKAREVLGKFPEQVVSTCSGNIVKNVKGVVVPATGGLRGIEAATLIGAVGRPRQGARAPGEEDLPCEALREQGQAPHHRGDDRRHRQRIG